MRRWREEDAAILFHWASDYDIGSRAGWPPHKTLEDSINTIRNIFLNDYTWAVILKETQEVIGCIGYLTEEYSNIKIGGNEAEIGYWIAKPYWNHGLCTEALQTLAEYCFTKKHFVRLCGDHFPDNPASGRVMRKCGFTEDGQQHFRNTTVQVLKRDNPNPIDTVGNQTI